MKTAAWSIVAILAGLVVGFVVVAVIEMSNLLFFPPPAGIDYTNEAAMTAWSETLPGTAFLAVLTAWLVGTFFGAFTAARLAAVGKMVHALVIGAFFQAAGIAEILMRTHPLWFNVAGMAVFLPAALAAGVLATRRPNIATA